MDIFGVSPLPGDGLMLLALLFATRLCWKGCAGRKDVDLFQILFAVLIILDGLTMLSGKVSGTLLENSPLVVGTIKKWYELTQHNFVVGAIAFLVFFAVQALLHYVMDIFTGATSKKGG